LRTGSLFRNKSIDSIPGIRIRIFDIPWPNLREQYIFQGLDLHWGQNKWKFIERISDFQKSLGNSDYDIQCPALHFNGHLPGTSVKIKLLTILNNQFSMPYKHSTYNSSVKTHYCWEEVS
jgi:hypothetical protein